MLWLGETLQQISLHQKWYIKVIMLKESMIYRFTWKLREFQNTCFTKNRKNIEDKLFILK